MGQPDATGVCTHCNRTIDRQWWGNGGWLWVHRDTERTECRRTTDATPREDSIEELGEARAMTYMPLADLVTWGGRTLCKCPHCGGLDVSYLGRDGLDICGTCHGLFVCRQEPVL